MKHLNSFDSDFENLKTAIEKNSERMDQNSCLRCVFFDVRVQCYNDYNDIDGLEGWCTLNPPERITSCDDDIHTAEQFMQPMCYPWNTCSKFLRLTGI